MTSVRFTEEMLGHGPFGELDFARGAQPSRDGSTAFKFHLTIEVSDIESFAHDPLRPATATGWIESDAFGGKLGIYLRQIAHFLTYASEEVPFPFSEWPEQEKTVKPRRSGSRSN